MQKVKTPLAILPSLFRLLNNDAIFCILFNNIYKPPFIAVDQTSANTFSGLIEQMKLEMQIKLTLAKMEMKHHEREITWK